MLKLNMLCLALLVTCGCQAVQVAENAVDISAQSRFVAEQQVLNNLAMLAADPNAMPYYSTMIQGQDQLARTAQLTYTPNLDLLTAPGYFFGRYVLDKQSLGLQGTRQNQESIQVSPTNDPDKLLLIQAALHRALGISDPYQVALQAALVPAQAVPTPPTTIRITPQPLEVKIVDGAKGGPPAKEAVEKKSFPEVSTSPPALAVASPANWQHYEEMIATGWFGIGKKKDVPKHACRVGHYCGTYVYVLPGHESDLARLTYVIMHLVSLDLSKLFLPPGTYGPRFTPLAPHRIQSVPFFPTLPSPSPT
jgi:hypothetical protein